MGRRSGSTLLPRASVSTSVRAPRHHRRRHPRILLVDSHDAIREALGLLLERRGFQVVGQVSRAGDATPAIKATNPAVLVVDLDLVDRPGSRIAREIEHRFAALPVLVRGDLEQLREHAASGTGVAGGLVLKTSDIDVLVTAVYAVDAGRRYVDPLLPALVEARSGDRRRLLTDAEREVFDLLLRDLSRADVAETLGRPLQDVDAQIRSGGHKLVDFPR